MPTLKMGSTTVLTDTTLANAVQDNITRLGTVTSGTFPAGHIIGCKMLANENAQSGHIESGSSSYYNSGIYGTYTPVKSSSDSWLRVTFHTGMQQSQTNTTMTDCTMDDTNSTTHASGNSMTNGTYSNRETHASNQSPTFNWAFIQTASGQVQAVTPSNQTTYSAGTPYYFRLYFQTSGGTFYFIHAGGYYNFWIDEIML